MPLSVPPAGNNVVGPSQISRVHVWNADAYTRIVIDLGGQAKYQSARVSNPDRIYFDIEGAKLSRELLRVPIEVPEGSCLKSVRIAQNRPNVVRVVLDVTEVKDYSVLQLANPDRLVVDVFGSNVTATASPAQSSSVASAARSVMTRDDPGEAVPGASAALPVKTTVRAFGPAAVPTATRSGDRSLTRALGLKVSRIVIDPGHGGHDTGTIGAQGLMEKDLALDVSLRLGKLIKERLPATEVVFTRGNDGFVPLEKRTQLANQAQADLFLSIHANSSGDGKAVGTETYYLDLNATADALQVAARENATAQRAVHELPDLVRKIASSEKVEESRDLAASIQDALTKRMGRQQKHNRGVRKAPFVVLIGANMPSVLAEISFLSNPEEEQWLKNPENRQRVAEGLYRGIERYLESTNSLASNTRTSVDGSVQPQ
jgi:N-acetylmuramoyl-L-alanine amidase